MPEYMLLLRGGDESGRTPEEAQCVIAQYIAWAGKLRAEGRLCGGDELAASGRVLRGTDGSVFVTDGPYPETKETIGGYFLIEAASMDDAAEIAKGCPGLLRGGEVELREIVDHS